jgi:hypothetical protein
VRDLDEDKEEEKRAQARKAIESTDPYGIRIEVVHLKAMTIVERDRIQRGEDEPSPAAWKKIAAQFPEETDKEVLLERFKEFWWREELKVMRKMKGEFRKLYGALLFSKGLSAQGIREQIKIITDQIFYELIDEDSKIRSEAREKSGIESKAQPKINADVTFVEVENASFSASRHFARTGGFKNVVVIPFSELRNNPQFRSKAREFIEKNGNNPELQIVIFAPGFRSELRAEDPGLAFFDGVNLFTERKSVQLYTDQKLSIVVDQKREEIGVVHGFSTRILVIGSVPLLSELSRRDTPKLIARPEAFEAVPLLHNLDGKIDWFRFADARGLLNPTRAVLNILNQVLSQLKFAVAA